MYLNRDHECANLLWKLSAEGERDRFFQKSTIVDFSMYFRVDDVKINRTTEFGYFKAKLVEASTANELNKKLFMRWVSLNSLRKSGLTY